jgi:hypothetical protein
MTPTTLVAPEIEEAIEQHKDAEHLLPRNGNGGSQSTLPVSSDSELEKLNENELKSAIKHAWKKHERLAKKDMGPLLYWLRVKLRAQGSRNDIIDKDRGFSAWVEDNLDISRATSHRWATEHARENGLGELKSTSSQVRRSDDDNPPGGGVLERDKAIQFTYWVSQKVHKQYEQALKTIKKQFKIADDKEAVLKGVCYAAEIIAARPRVEKRQRTTRTRR